MGRTYGYVCVSSKDQNEERQLQKMQQAGIGWYGLQ